MGFSEQELKALQELNEKIVETAPIGIHVVDPDFTVRSWNSYLEDYTTVKKEDIIGKNLFKVIPGLLEDRWDEEYERVIETGEPFERMGYKLTRSLGSKKGAVLYQNLRIAPLKHGDNIVGAITLIEDITERMLAEEELRKHRYHLEELVKERTAELTKANEQLQREMAEHSRVDEEMRQLKELNEGIVESAPIAIEVLDKDLVCRIWNRYCEGYTSVPKEKILGNKFFEVVPSLQKLGWDKVHKKVLETGEPFEVRDYRIVRTFGPNKGEAWYQNIRIVPLRQKGEIAGTITLLEDVTKRKLAEEQVKKSEEKLRAIIETLPVGVLITTPDGRLIDANPTAGKMFGYFSKEEALAVPVSNHYHNPKDRERFIDLIKKGPIKEFETQFRRKDGGIFWGSVTSTTQTTEAGEIEIISVIQDITERKKAEDELKRNFLKFRLEEGKLYLVKEPKPILSIEAFEELIGFGYHGLVLSRSPEKEFGKIEGSLSFRWLAEGGGDKALRPNTEEVEQEIAKMPIKSIILIDRLDYLVTKNSFRKTLVLVQRLRETAYLAGHIIILSVDTATLSTQELRLLEVECSEIEPMHKELSTDLLEVLKFVYRRNTLGLKPSYNEVGAEVGASKPTVRKRIRELIAKEYLFETKKGMHKVLEVGEKGKMLIQI